MKKDLHTSLKSLLQMTEFEILEIKGSGDFIPDSVHEPDNEEYLLSSLQRTLCFFLCCSQSVCQHSLMLLYNLDFDFNPNVFCWEESAMALLTTNRT